MEMHLETSNSKRSSSPVGGIGISGGVHGELEVWRKPCRGGTPASVRDQVQKQKGTREQSSDFVTSQPLILPVLSSGPTQVEAHQQGGLGEAVQRSEAFWGTKQGREWAQGTGIGK